MTCVGCINAGFTPFNYHDPPPPPIHEQARKPPMATTTTVSTPKLTQNDSFSLNSAQRYSPRPHLASRQRTSRRSMPSRRLTSAPPNRQPYRSADVLFRSSTRLSRRSRRRRTPRPSSFSTSRAASTPPVWTARPRTWRTSTSSTLRGAAPSA